MEQMAARFIRRLARLAKWVVLVGTVVLIIGCLFVIIGVRGWGTALMGLGLGMLLVANLARQHYHGSLLAQLWRERHFAKMAAQSSQASASQLRSVISPDTRQSQTISFAAFDAAMTELKTELRAAAANIPTEWASLANNIARSTGTAVFIGSVNTYEALKQVADLPPDRLHRIDASSAQSRRETMGSVEWKTLLIEATDDLNRHIAEGRISHRMLRWLPRDSEVFLLHADPQEPLDLLECLAQSALCTLSLIPIAPRAKRVSVHVDLLED